MTSEKQSSLILGVSRAAQGIVPKTLNENLEVNEQGFFNFAFSGSTSPYGQVYYNAVSMKVDPKTKNGIFILGVNPMNLSCRSVNDEFVDTTALREHGGFLDELWSVNSNPNFQYLFQYYNKPYYWLYLIDRSPNKTGFVHDDGWLEITVPMGEEAEKRKAAKLATYIDKVKKFKLHSYRFQWLKREIQFLKKHGTVYLVRIPVDERMYRIEEDAFPEFDDLLKEVATDEEVPYFDFTHLNKSIETTDANHLFKESAYTFSEVLADSIKVNL